MGNGTHEFHYLDYETVLGNHPQYPNTLVLRVNQDDVQALFYKMVRAVRDHASQQQITIPLSGRLVSAEDAKPDPLGGQPCSNVLPDYRANS